MERVDRSARGGASSLAVYEFLDAFFFVFHSALVLFNLTGWWWRSTRRWHLLVVGLTCLSWFGLGVFFGFGYCPSTDWHWEVKRELGEVDLPDSWVKYYLDRVSGGDWHPTLVDGAVLTLGLAAFVLSAALNWRDHHQVGRGRRP